MADGSGADEEFVQQVCGSRGEMIMCETLGKIEIIFSKT
jgi:hypothetical protein